jgi:hypothetical protein
MRELGHPWSRATVSEVERRGRTVTVDELLALALVFEANRGGQLSLADLLDPQGVSGRNTTDVDFGPNTVPSRFVSAWVRGQPRTVWVRRKDGLKVFAATYVEEDER